MTGSPEVAEAVLKSAEAVEPATGPVHLRRGPDPRPTAVPNSTAPTPTAPSSAEAPEAAPLVLGFPSK